MSDYDAPTQAELTARLATALAVDAAAVSLNVTAASVHLLFAVQVAGSAEAAAVVAQVDRIMPTADATTSALGISVLSSPFATVLGTTVQPAPLSTPPTLHLPPPPSLPPSGPSAPPLLPPTSHTSPLPGSWPQPPTLPSSPSAPSTLQTQPPSPMQPAVPPLLATPPAGPPPFKASPPLRPSPSALLPVTPPSSSPAIPSSLDSQDNQGVAGDEAEGGDSTVTIIGAGAGLAAVVVALAALAAWRRRRARHHIARSSARAASQPARALRTVEVVRPQKTVATVPVAVRVDQKV